MKRSTAIVRFRWMMAVFIVGLVVSGVTAFPLLREMRLLTDWMGLAGASSPAGHAGLKYWILSVRFGLEESYARFPWIAYGTDWLAFGHVAIAFFFVGALIRPSESRLIIFAGMAACVAVIPTALICGSVRGIPLYWSLIDCSFGVFGILPLLYCLRLLRTINENPA